MACAEAQFDLGMHYLYPEHRPKQGLPFLVCAARQGHGEAAYKIGTFLAMFKNQLMAVEYYLPGDFFGLF